MSVAGENVSSEFCKIAAIVVGRGSCLRYHGGNGRLSVVQRLGDCGSMSIDFVLGGSSDQIGANAVLCGRISGPFADFGGSFEIRNLCL